MVRILTGDGSRSDESRGPGKLWGRTMDERARALAKGDTMEALALHEQSLLTRVRMNGLWNDPFTAEANYVSCSDVQQLVVECIEQAERHALMQQFELGLSPRPPALRRPSPASYGAGSLAVRSRLQAHKPGKALGCQPRRVRDASSARL